MRILYLRDGKNNPVATIAVNRSNIYDGLTAAWAVCSPKDSFHKRIGRSKAMGRLVGFDDMGAVQKLMCRVHAMDGRFSPNQDPATFARAVLKKVMKYVRVKGDHRKYFEENNARYLVREFVREYGGTPAFRKLTPLWEHKYEGV